MNLIQLFVCCWLSNAERRILSRGVKAVGPAKPLKEELQKTETQISKLLDAHLEGLLEADEYHNKKAELIEKKMALKQKIAQIGQKGNHWLEPLENWLKEVNQIQNLISRNNLREKGEFFRKLGSNRQILDGKIIFDAVGVWKTYLNLFGREQKFLAAEPRSGEAALLTNLVWRDILELARTYFEKNF